MSDTRIDLAEFELMTYPGTDIVAVALACVDGEDVEPLLVTLDRAGGLRVEAEVVLPLGIDLRATFGGLSFASLSQRTRGRVVRMVLDRATDALLGDAA